MQVFISWSGDQSRAVAEVLRKWLTDVIQLLEPWVSSEDIRAGARWSHEVARKLEETRFGIVCLTRENLSEPWLLFESGALAKTLEQSRVCPFLLDLSPADLVGPLVQFQAVRTTRGDVRRMIQSLNEGLEQAALSDVQVDRAFEKWWPELEASLGRIPRRRQGETAEVRSDRDLLEEVLDRVRRAKTWSDRSRSPSPHALRRLGGLSSLFEGDDVEAVLRSVDEFEHDADENAAVWARDTNLPDASELAGWWSTRWSGGTARDEWVTGIARVVVFGENFYALTHDGRADCLIAARSLLGDRLAGRYVNLAVPSEVLPWAGRIVTNKRIDGSWGAGRWDLQRLSENDDVVQ